MKASIFAIISLLLVSGFALLGFTNNTDKAPKTITKKAQKQLPKALKAPFKTLKMKQAYFGPDVIFGEQWKEIDKNLYHYFNVSFEKDGKAPVAYSTFPLGKGRIACLVGTPGIYPDYMEMTAENPLPNICLYTWNLKTQQLEYQFPVTEDFYSDLMGRYSESWLMDVNGDGLLDIVKQSGGFNELAKETAEAMSEIYNVPEGIPAAQDWHDLEVLLQQKSLDADGRILFKKDETIVIDPDGFDPNAFEMGDFMIPLGC